MEYSAIRFTDGTLYHHGIKGQKWGVRRTEEQLARIRGALERASDNSARKSAKRHVAAAKKNLKTQAKLASEADAQYDQVYSNYRKTVSTPAFSQKKKRERIKLASEEVGEAGKAKESARAEYLRAKRIYEEDVNTYRERIQTMMDKYGPQSVSALRTKNVKYARNYVEEVIRTGITVADLPVIGTWYSGRYISRKDYADRSALIDERAKKKY